MPPGEQRRIQSGYDGCTVQTYRNIYDSGGNLLRSGAEARSVYRSRDEILLVGARPREEPAHGAGEEDTPPESSTGEEQTEERAAAALQEDDDPLPLRRREDFTE